MQLLITNLSYTFEDSRAFINASNASGLLILHFTFHDWENVDLLQVSIQQILQIYSFLSSILAIAMAFASNYSMRKEGKSLQQNM